ncbi:hypothetical protein GOV08_01835 [Candidatus Woesearchaeota archaeon]|nr:hypothetical protein [Candidatus Woesearchaeota archaeon]
MTLVVEAGLPDDNGACTQMKPIGEQSGGVFRMPFSIQRKNPTGVQGNQSVL